MASKVTLGPSGWVGWVYFASAMLLVVGGMQVIAGLVALFKPTYYVVGTSGLVAFNFTTWGWIHLALGVLAIATAAGIMAGAMWARMVGVLVTALAMISNVAFLNEYPLWSTIALIVNGCIIYALTLHGNEVES